MILRLLPVLPSRPSPANNTACCNALQKERNGPGLRPNSNDLQPNSANSNGLRPNSHGLHPSSDSSTSTLVSLSLPSQEVVMSSSSACHARGKQFPEQRTQKQTQRTTGSCRASRCAKERLRSRLEPKLRPRGSGERRDENEHSSQSTSWILDALQVSDLASSLIPFHFHLFFPFGFLDELVVFPRRRPALGGSKWHSRRERQAWGVVGQIKTQAEQYMLFHCACV